MVGPAARADADRAPRTQRLGRNRLAALGAGNPPRPLVAVAVAADVSLFVLVPAVALEVHAADAADLLDLDDSFLDRLRRPALGFLGDLLGGDRAALLLAPLDRDVVVFLAAGRDPLRRAFLRRDVAVGRVVEAAVAGLGSGLGGRIAAGGAVARILRRCIGVAGAIASVTGGSVGF